MPMLIQERVTMSKQPGTGMRCRVCGKLVDDAPEWMHELFAEYPHIFTYRCADCGMKDDDHVRLWDALREGDE